MSILAIARMGHPVLLRPARPVPDPAAPGIRLLVRNMCETLAEVRGLGLAAPQVHVPLRLVILHHPDRTGEAPMVLINPVVTPDGDDTLDGWEGCLSVPGLRGVVPRFRRIRLSAVDQENRPVSIDADGMYARVIQHECDHLDGVLYPRRMTDMRLLVFEEEMRHWNGDDQEEDVSG